MVFFTDKYVNMTFKLVDNFKGTIIRCTINYNILNITIGLINHRFYCIFNSLLTIITNRYNRNFHEIFRLPILSAGLPL